MSLLFFDGGGNYYGTSEITRVWNGMANTTVASAAGRFGHNALRLIATTSNVTAGFPGAQTIFCGFNWKANALPGSGQQPMINFYGGGQVHLQLFIEPSGNIGLERAGTDLGVNGPFNVTSDTDYYIEVRVTIDNGTSGLAEIRINEQSGGLVTSIDTQNSGLPICDAIRLRGPNGTNTDFSDIYVCDTAGAAPQNTFLGDCRSDVILPDGDGTTSAFDTTFPASPTTHYTKVDEVTPNDDTDYNETATAADVDLFDYAALPTIVGGSTVMGVQAAIGCKKLDAGTAEIRAVARPVATNRNGTTLPVSTNYRYIKHLWQDNPETSAPWTDALINASEFGPEKI